MTRRSRRPRPKARKPKYLSLRRHLAPPTPPAPPEEQSASSSCDMPPGAAPVAGAVEGEDGSKRRPPQTEPSPLQPPDHLDRDPHVASLLLLLDDGNRSIAALFGDDGAAESSGSPPSATDSPASSSMNWDGLARRALRGRERWVYCHSSSPPPAASSSGDEEASSAGGGAGRGAADLWWRFAGTAGGSKALALKLDYEEILAAWSDRGPLYIEGDAPQVVPRLHGGCSEPYYAFPVMVEVGPSDAWRVPDIIDAAAAAAAAASGGRTTAEAGDERSREERVQRYKEKRRSRLFAKRIRYEVRKQNAQKRPRFKGRFVKQEI